MPELHDLSWLPEEHLHDWVVEQRWFASKSREVTHLNVVEAVPLRSESPILVLTLMEAVFPAGTHETYQVPLGLRPADDGWT
jgi:maltokinase